MVVGKWLASNSRIVIFDESTREIDVATKVEIYNLMNRLKQQGISVMFVSFEISEVMGIADRIVVRWSHHRGADGGEATQRSQNDNLERLIGVLLAGKSYSLKLNQISII